MIFYQGAETKLQKKWITKAEIAKILSVYSIRKNEFEPIGDSGHFYQSKIVKGYTISISQEILEAKDYSEKTGRIVVSHTQHNGKKTFNDIWQRDQDGTLQFRFRNLWNQPFSDSDYIQELKEQLGELKKEISSSSPGLSDRFAQLQAENTMLKQQLALYTKHNARGAGRKPSEKRISAIRMVKDLLESGYSDQEILTELGISRSTFYRYKKNVNN